MIHLYTPQLPKCCCLVLQDPGLEDNCTREEEEDHHDSGRNDVDYALMTSVCHGHQTPSLT